MGGLRHGGILSEKVMKIVWGKLVREFLKMKCGKVAGIGEIVVEGDSVY